MAALRGLKTILREQAIMHDAGIDSAIAIWRHHKIWKFNFKKQKLSEYELSRITWRDCYSEKFYEENKQLIHKWNNKLIDVWNEQNPETPIARVRDKETTGPKLGELVTKICKPDLRQAVKKIKYRTSTATTHLVKAMDENETFEANQNIGQLINEGINAKLGSLPGMTEDKKVKLIGDWFKTQLEEAVKQIDPATISKQITSNLIAHFDNNGDIEEIDKCNNDKYSEAAKKRRQKNKGD